MDDITKTIKKLDAIYEQAMSDYYASSDQEYKSRLLVTALKAVKSKFKLRNNLGTSSFGRASALHAGVPNKTSRRKYIRGASLSGKTSALQAENEGFKSLALHTLGKSRSQGCDELPSNAPGNGNTRHDGFDSHTFHMKPYCECKNAKYYTGL